MGRCGVQPMNVSSGEQWTRWASGCHCGRSRTLPLVYIVPFVWLWHQVSGRFVACSRPCCRQVSAGTHPVLLLSLHPRLTATVDLCICRKPSSTCTAQSPTGHCSNSSTRCVKTNRRLHEQRTDDPVDTPWEHWRRAVCRLEPRTRRVPEVPDW